MDKYVGIPFMEKGRDFSTGVDCWGLVQHIYKCEYGVQLPDYTDLYADTKDRAIGGVINENLAQSWEPVQEPQRGDIIILRLMGQPFHVGVVIDNTSFIHCENGVGTVIESYKGMKWKKRTLGFYRLA